MAQFNGLSTPEDLTEVEDVPEFQNASLVLQNFAKSDLDQTDFTITGANGLPPYDHNETWLGDENNSRLNRNSLSEQHESLVISQQPLPGNQSSRVSVPVYTPGWSSIPTSPYIMPMTGLDFLIGVPEVVIQQTVEDLIAPSSTNSRYVVKIPDNETLYVASENSTQLQQLCLRSQRGFQMSLLDPTRQEAASFVRHTGCPASIFGCCLQELDIFTDQNQIFIGKIRQDWTVATVSYTILDENYVAILKVNGPRDLCFWGLALDQSFSITTKDCQTKLGTISRKWDNNFGDYVWNVIFPAPGSPVTHKTLILGATLLIEYSYFSNRRNGCCRWC